MSVPEAVAYMETHPGTTQAEAAKMAGVTRQAMTKAVTKGKHLPNVTVDPADSHDYTDDAEVKALIKLLFKMSWEQKVFVWQKILPQFKP